MEFTSMKNILSVLFATSLLMSSHSFAAATAATTDQPQVVSAKAVAQQAAININTADAQTLIKLKGIGQKKAEAIIAWRKANGAFKTVEQFADVKGIGEATLEANRKNIRI
jgi:competence protein ComEA